LQVNSALRDRRGRLHTGLIDDGWQTEWDRQPNPVSDRNSETIFGRPTGGLDRRGGSGRCCRAITPPGLDFLRSLDLDGCGRLFRPIPRSGGLGFGLENFADLNYIERLREEVIRGSSV